MTHLCVRCAHLFAECRPLLGASCPQNNLPAPPRPNIKTAAVVMQDMRTGAAEIKVVQAIDFRECCP